MDGVGVIDRFLEVFTRYIDSGFGLLGGDVAFLAACRLDLIRRVGFVAWVDSAFLTGAVMSNFRQVDRETGFLLPPSVDEWLPERHLARFVVEVIERLDLSAMVGAYRGSGSASYHPCVLLGLLVYGYATGVFSSRQLERATYIRWRSASSPPTIIPTTTPSPRSGAGFSRRSKGCSSRS